MMYRDINTGRNTRPGGNRGGYPGGRNEEMKSNIKYEKLTDENYVETAEAVIRELIKLDERSLVSTSQIRNLLAMTADIYNEVMNLPDEKTELTREIIANINYLKVRFIYESGRNGNTGVKNLVVQGNILQHLADIKKDRKQYIIFSRYMEALVAYRKFLGRRETN